MKFCHQICLQDEECTAFSYNLLIPGTKENCIFFTKAPGTGFTGDGNTNDVCFSKEQSLAKANDGAK